MRNEQKIEADSPTLPLKTMYLRNEIYSGRERHHIEANLNQTNDLHQVNVIFPSPSNLFMERLLFLIVHIKPFSYATSTGFDSEALPRRLEQDVTEGAGTLL